jgi:DNA-binding CsgD family transcriptional regulator
MTLVYFIYLQYANKSSILIVSLQDEEVDGMLYLTVKEAAEKWGLGTRIVTLYCTENRIEGAVKRGNLWLIPEHAVRPADNRRREQPVPRPSLSEELAHLLVATTVPMPIHNPDAILNELREERLSLQYEAELSYLRGDFARVMRCYDKTEGDEAARLRASLAAVAAAISLGDYSAYLKIEAYLKSCLVLGRGSDSSAIAELALASVAVIVAAPNMVPKWLSEGDFSSFQVQAPPTYMLYLRAKYFMCIGKYEIALAVAQTALTCCIQEQGITFSEIYLRVVCAVACHYLGRDDEAWRRLLEAMRLALPHGFITPFAEHVADFGGLMEKCLEQEFPHRCNVVIEQWKRTVKNWVTFHNNFTKDNITLLLSLRECHLAQMVARRVPYAKIAAQYGISVGRLKNIMMEIYEKLYISSRDELAQYVLMTTKGDGS